LEKNHLPLDRSFALQHALNSALFRAVSVDANSITRNIILKLDPGIGKNLMEQLPGRGWGWVPARPGDKIMRRKMS
jgi:hypothetical protein